MSLKVKVKKLSRMSARELLFRVRETVRLPEERKKYPAERAEAQADEFNFFAQDFQSDFLALKSGKLTEALKQSRWLRQLPVPLHDEKAQQFQILFPEAVQSSIERADRFLQHQFSFLGISVNFPREIPWQKDPVSGMPYPPGFYRDIDIFTNDDKTDIKHVWELNRLQFLIEIAKAYYLTGEQKYRDEIDFLVSDWYEQNPYKTGVAWTSALEVGVRAFSWLWTFNFYLASQAANPKTVFVLLKLLYLSGCFIKENLSIFFSPYNHLVGEAAALFLLGYFFPGFKNAKSWEREGWQILCDQIEKQFHPDGGTVEQAMFYHHFTLGFYLQCLNARRLNQDPVPEPVVQRVEKALEFAMFMTRPDRTLPWIGDNDAARSLYFSFPAHWNFAGFQAIGAVWFNRGDMKWCTEKFSEEAFWLLPVQSLEKFVQMKTVPPTGKTFHLPDSGYFIFRGGWSEKDHFSLMDCGPLAAGVFQDGTPSAAHGHADLLSLEIAPCGESLLIDPGFSNYRGGLHWHRYFRSTAAHNTIEIDEQSQAQQVGILNWRFAPRFKTLQFFRGQAGVGACGEHYGYHRLADKPTHRRYFLFIDASFWLSLDVVWPAQNRSKAMDHQLKHHFHFSQYSEVDYLPEKRGFFIKGQRSQLAIELFHSCKAEPILDIKKGGMRPEEGWISPTYRDRRPAPVASWTVRSPLPVYLLTLYLPAPVNEPLPEIKKEGNALLFAQNQKRFRIYFQPEPEKTNGRISQNAAAIIEVLHLQKKIAIHNFAAKRAIAEFEF